MKVLLIGPQGSGKSTQGKLLAVHLKIPYISTGDIFRKIAQEDSEEGRRIKQILESGHLVDDETAIELIKNRLISDDCQSGFILDGYPRTLPQAEKVNINFDKVFYLQIPQDEILRRLLQRGRVDDNEESIKKRLEHYSLQTQPLLDYYKDQGKLFEINATGNIDNIFQSIKTFLS